MPALYYYRTSCSNLPKTQQPIEIQFPPHLLVPCWHFFSSVAFLKYSLQITRWNFPPLSTEFHFYYISPPQHSFDPQSPPLNFVLFLCMTRLVNYNMRPSVFLMSIINSNSSGHSHKTSSGLHPIVLLTIVTSEHVHQPMQASTNSRALLSVDELQLSVDRTGHYIAHPLPLPRDQHSPHLFCKLYLCNIYDCLRGSGISSAHKSISTDLSFLHGNIIIIIVILCPCPHSSSG